MLAYVWTFGSVLWAMFWFYIWFLIIWMFIRIFADIFHRNDIGGWAKAGWIFLIIIVPFLGILIYMIARPKMTAQDRADMEQVQEVTRRATGYSSAEEIEKAAQLKASGAITDAEFEEMKRRAMAT